MRDQVHRHPWLELAEVLALLAIVFLAMAWWASAFLATLPSD